MEILCTRCGLCCWGPDKDGNVDACEHLAADLRTCTIHDRKAELRPECKAFPTPHDAPALDTGCGYLKRWMAEGVVTVGN